PKSTTFTRSDCDATASKYCSMPSAVARLPLAPMRKPKCASGVGTSAASRRAPSGNAIDVRRTTREIRLSGLGMRPERLLRTGKARDRRAEMRGGIVPEFEAARVPLECRLYSGALYAAAAAVNESNFAQAPGRSG